jgi:AcrR family transcriptional regulator
MATLEKEKRRYGGASFEDRQAERRRRLMLAAIAVFERMGRDGATVAAICAEAGLTARYFYESFPNLDALFLEAYRAVQQELLADIARHAADDPDPVKAALHAFFAAMAEHPGPARVFLLDPHGREPEMQAAGYDTAAKLLGLLAPGVRDPLALAGVLGAVVDIARRWVSGGFQESVDRVTETALRFTRAGAGN